MLLECEVCGASEWESPCTRCDHVKDKFKKLKQELWDREKEIDRIKDAVLFVLRDASKDLLEEKAETKIQSKLLKELWSAAELKWHPENSMRYFCSEQLIDGEVCIKAGDLFRKTDRSFVEKLELLRKALITYSNFNDYGENYKPVSWLMSKLSRERKYGFLFRFIRNKLFRTTD